jgi:hypothetical protein
MARNTVNRADPNETEAEKKKREAAEALEKLGGAVVLAVLVAVILVALVFLAPGMVVVALLTLPFRLFGLYLPKSFLLILAALASLGILVYFWRKYASIKKAAIKFSLVGGVIVLVVGGPALFFDARWAEDFYSLFFGDEEARVASVPTSGAEGDEAAHRQPSPEAGRSPTTPRPEVPKGEIEPRLPTADSEEAVASADEESHTTQEEIVGRPAGWEPAQRTVPGAPFDADSSGRSSSSNSGPDAASAGDDANEPMRAQGVTDGQMAPSQGGKVELPSATPVPTRPPTPAEVAWEDADWGRAFALYSKEAEAGRPDAQARIGRMYYEGLGRPPDMDLAEQWFRKAADRGSAEGRYRLALLYSDGRKGAPWDLAVAHRYLVEAAESHADAAAKLGKLYWRGIGVGEDHVQARSWYQRAARLGSREAVDWLRANP